jgi:hypothetical protein
MPQLYPGRRYTRTKAPLGILRGYRPTEPGHLSVTAKPKDGEAIKQGMAITLDNNGEWVKAPTAARATLTVSVFVARQDQDDPAVQASGKLTGLDCSGEFEFLTGYIVPNTFARDMELTVDPGTGNFAVATTGQKVVGKVSALGTGAGGLIAFDGLTPPTATAADAARVQFKTVAPYMKA